MSAARTISLSVITSLNNESEFSVSSDGAIEDSLDSVGAVVGSSIAEAEQPAKITVVISSVGISAIDFVI
jgi:hypothetical protein